jgi:hypothetical protein
MQAERKSAAAREEVEARHLSVGCAVWHPSHGHRLTPFARPLCRAAPLLLCSEVYEMVTILDRNNKCPGTGGGGHGGRDEMALWIVESGAGKCAPRPGKYRRRVAESFVGLTRSGRGAGRWGTMSSASGASAGQLCRGWPKGGRFEARHGGAKVREGNSLIEARVGVEHRAVVAPRVGQGVAGWDCGTSDDAERP